MCCVYILIINSLYCRILHVFDKHLLLCAFDMQNKRQLTYLLTYLLTTVNRGKGVKRTWHTEARWR